MRSYYLTAALFVVLSSGYATAQPHSTKTSDVTIVLVDSLQIPSDAATITRSSKRSEVNIVQVKKSELSPELLSVALQYCTASIAHHGKSPVGPVHISIPTGRHRPPLDSERRRAMVEIVDQLRNAKARTIKGVGHYPAIVTAVSDSP